MSHSLYVTHEDLKIIVDKISETLKTLASNEIDIFKHLIELKNNDDNIVKRVQDAVNNISENVGEHVNYVIAIGAIAQAASSLISQHTGNGPEQLYAAIAEKIDDAEVLRIIRRALGMRPHLRIVNNDQGGGKCDQ